MPLYEYECRKCGNRFEIQQKATEKQLRKCTHVNGGNKKACGGDLKKLFFPAVIIFKGSGWHIKDYAKGGGNGGKPKSESTEPLGSESKSSTETKSSSDSKSGSESKSEKKKETVSASKD